MVNLPSIGTKHLDAIGHSGLSTVFTLNSSFDVVHYHALGPGLIAPVARALSGATVIQTIHGLDNDRNKWGGFAQRVLGLAAWMSARVPDHTIVVSEALQAHYQQRYGREAACIPNGVERGVTASADLLEKFGLKPSKYVLFVGRLVPEKAPDLLIRAFSKLDTSARLVIAGGSSFTDGYVQQLTQLAAKDDRVVMPGYVYGQDLAALYSHAGAFVLPSALEGLPLTLLEAAGHGTPIVASDIPPHREVLRADGVGHRLVREGDEDALAIAIAGTLHAGSTARTSAKRMREDVLRRYDWDAAADTTEAVYYEAASRKAAA